MKIIARAYTDLPEKFGVPRQSGLSEKLCGKIVFEPEFRNPEAIRGIDGFSHLWLIWEFSKLPENRREWSPTVRPPRLGGNKRVGVFATRSPFRPNPIGLSSVKLEEVRNEDGLGKVLYVSGIDLVDKTPIYDIKPYLPYVDCHADATDGFAADTVDYSINVVISDELKNMLPSAKLDALISILSQDPRPSYQNDPKRVYGMKFSGYEVRFYVDDGTLYVKEITSTE